MQYHSPFLGVYFYEFNNLRHNQDGEYFHRSHILSRPSPYLHFLQSLICFLSI